MEYMHIISARKATKNEQKTYELKMSKMKDEYDFSNAEQGRFYRSIDELDIPIYLDKEVKDFFIKKIRMQGAKFSLNEIVNSLLKSDIAISDRLSSSYCEQLQI